MENSMVTVNILMLASSKELAEQVLGYVLL